MEEREKLLFHTALVVVSGGVQFSGNTVTHHGILTHYVRVRSERCPFTLESVTEQPYSQYTAKYRQIPVAWILVFGLKSKYCYVKPSLYARKT